MLAVEFDDFQSFADSRRFLGFGERTSWLRMGGRWVGWCGHWFNLFALETGKTASKSSDS